MLPTLDAGAGQELTITQQRAAALANSALRNPIATLLADKDVRKVRTMLAAMKADLEALVASQPDSYGPLVMLGEIDLRIGLSSQAQALLYRASLLPPPSWEAYQRTGYLLRRAEEQMQHAFPRPAGAPPPGFVWRPIAAFFSKVRSLFSQKVLKEEERA